MKGKLGEILRMESDWWSVLYIFIALVLTFSLVGTFATETNTYLLKSPTQEQLIAIIEGDSQNRVWYGEARYVLGGSSLVEVDLRAKIFEDSRITNFLDGVGVEYTLIR